ncbi:hypothetical protein U2A4042360027 [Corynebacterium striatum]|nr:hypothetical protein U2A4042360027 [Corynebacterium striatum]
MNLPVRHNSLCDEKIPNHPLVIAKVVV